MSRMSESVRTRAARGVALAAQVKRRDAALEVGTLLHDEDTFVILRTATALLERRDAAGLRLVVEADTGLASAAEELLAWTGLRR